jgi:hypothetical protein
MYRDWQAAKNHPRKDEIEAIRVRGADQNDAQLCCQDGTGRNDRNPAYGAVDFICGTGEAGVDSAHGQTSRGAAPSKKANRGKARHSIRASGRRQGR